MLVVALRTKRTLTLLCFFHIQDVQSPLLLRFLKYPMSCGRTLNKYIINTFQERNPKIKIELIEVEKTSLDVYNLENVERILGLPGRDAFDLVEVDTVLLGEIVDSNLLQPIEIDTSRFLPQAAKAVTYNRKTYGFPTMVCSNFLVTTSNPKGTTHSDALIGKFTGSWTAHSII